MRFHGEILREIKQASNRFSDSALSEEIQPVRSLHQSINYHTNFITEVTRAGLLESAYEIDFSQIEILEKVKKQASTSPSILDIISL